MPPFKPSVVQQPVVAASAGTAQEPAVGQPAASLLAALCAELARHPPFAQMEAVHVAAFVAGSRQQYHAPGEVMLAAGGGPVSALWCLRQGAVLGQPAPNQAGADDAPFELLAGDLFPIAAVLAQRAVSSTYTAQADCFSLVLPLAEVQRLQALSPPFAQFLQHRVAQFMALSRQALQQAWTSQTLAAQSLEAPLSSLQPRQPLACSADTPLQQALSAMHQRRVGSVLVVDTAQAPLGILTRHDILDRVTLAQRPLHTPLGEVMTAPVHSLSTAHTLQDAALLMARHGVRHVPVTEAGRLVNVVSERDLFALQRLSLKQLSTQLRAAPDTNTVVQLGAQVRSFARQLLGQGVQARPLTELVSHLNDVLTERLVHLVAQRRGLDLGQACWLAFGSEGRGEQTVATDQDNGLVFASEQPEADRPRWLALGQEVNEALAAAGYPLCGGGVMAGMPGCCLSVQEWRQRLQGWVRHGEPEDLLNASIFFDLRPLCGHLALAEPLAALPAQLARQAPRFLHNLAQNALRRVAPLNWRGAIATQDEGGRQWLDLKLQGTALFVDAARLFALAQGLSLLGTRQRLAAVAPALHVPAHEAQAWLSAFDVLQTLRLRVQLPAEGAVVGAQLNRLDLATLNDIDRRLLKEALRVARRLQQRLALDLLP